MVAKEYRTDMLIWEMNISHFMTHGLQIEKEKI